MQSSLVVKVVPKSCKNEIIGWENNALKIRLRAVPEKGQANEALIDFLSQFLRIAKSQITITHGETSRLKKLRISGISQSSLDQKLAGP